MTLKVNTSFGRVAYEAYTKSLDIEWLPTWDSLGSDIQFAWEAAALAVREQ
jgi:hypothetical protein